MHCGVFCQVRNQQALGQMEELLQSLCCRSLGTTRLLQACADAESATERKQLLQVLFNYNKHSAGQRLGVCCRAGAEGADAEHT